MAPSANIFPDPCPAISGYTCAEQLYLGSRTAVYRAVQTATQRPVVIKVLRSNYPSFGELVQFRNQYMIAKNLPIPGIVQPLSLEPLDNGYALVMADEGGGALGKYLRHQSLVLTDVLAIAIQLADILHDLGQHRVVHKDIKPANILIHPESKAVQLIDFSIASLLPKETQEIQSPNILEGTLAYIAPEQTGRMNRCIDYRADFYALGVTLYQLLSGTLPFTSDDPMELIHCHLARIPVPVHEVNPAVPRRVSAIVTKLMAKNAEDRYQSALGLKHDLARCLTEWTTTGEVSEFELGQRDLSDHFLIPEKLYGRATEVAQLLAAFERVADGASELMLVAGFSGIGKTAVVNEVHKPIVRQRGYFIKGKFDQFNRNIPLSAFVQALRDLMGQLLSESDVQVAQWRTQILTALGENGQVLIDVIPELELIIGPQSIATELSGNAAQNRFNLLFQKFIAVFTLAEHPLVLFLDDLQWADSASLQLIQLLMSDNGYLLMLGAYRDNEVSPLHPFILMVEEIKKTNAIVNTITLHPLAFADTNHLVADTLNCSRELAQPLTELINRKTQGNPFFVTQFLKALHEDGKIIFDRERHYWECDIAQVNALALTDDVVEFMVLQLQKLPDETQHLLKLAACIGNQFDLSTLAIVAERSTNNAATALWKALQEGLILPTSQVYKFFQEEELVDAQSAANPTYRFLHDRVQQAAYSLIVENLRQSTHLKIGQLLYNNYSEQDQEERLFEIVNHLNLGRYLINRPIDSQALAEMNLKATIKAKISTAYSTAKNYVQLGISLLEKNCWQTQYQLALKLYTLAAEMSYLTGDFERLKRESELVLREARNILDKTKIYEIQIATQTLQGNALKAVDWGREALLNLGVEIPQEANETEICKALQTLDRQLENIQIPALANLPITTDATTQAAMHIMGILFAPIIQGMPSFLPVLGSKMVCLSIQVGNTTSSTIGYALHGLVMSAFLADSDKSYALGKVALSLLERSNNRGIQPIVLFLFGNFIQSHKEHLRDTIKTLKAAYQAGVETGDFMYAGFSLATHSNSRFFSGEELGILVEDMSNFSFALGRMKQYSAQAYINLGHKTAGNLIKPVSQPHHLTGDIYDETVMLPRHQLDNDRTAMAELFIYKLLLASIFGNYADAISYADEARQYLDSVSGSIFVPIFYFYAALVKLKGLSAESDLEKNEVISVMETDQFHLMRFALHAPMNHQHKVDLIEAEKCRVLGQKYEAGDRYDRAIAGAKANGFIQEEALANELAAKFYLGWGKDRIASSYMQEAYYCYARWGAKAKTDKLEECYPELLRPMLEERARSLDPLETLVNLTNPSLAISVSRSQQTSTRHLNTSINIAAIIQTAQSLSSTINLEELLQQLAKIILQYSGGDHCALILPDRVGEWQVRAIATPETTQIQRTPLTGNPDLPTKLIQYVKNTQKIIVVNDLQTELPVIDEYLLDHNPKSLLCLPILKQGELIGILYLKNRFMSGAFNHDHLSILNFLCIQAAISLENARLFAETMQAEASLRQSQIQLQNTANNLPGIVYQFRLDADGNPSFPFISDRSRELMGFDPQTLQQSAATAIQCMEPPDREMFQMLVAESIKTLNPFVWTGRFNLPSGEQKWIEARSIPTCQADGAIVWDGVMLDVSERKLAETKLARSEAKFRSLVEDTSDVIYSLDVAGIFTYVSPQVTEITGYQPAELIGRLGTDFIHPEDIPLVIVTIEQIVTTQEKQTSIEMRIASKTSGWCWVVFNNSPVKDTDGKIIGIQGIGRDVTAQKAVLQERQRQADALQAIVEGTAGKTGADFYQACTKYLAEIFDVQYAFLTRLLDPDFNQMEMLSLWTGEGFVEPYVMELAGTPCLATYQNSWSVFPSALQSHFPNASSLATLGAESYLSVVIRDFEGKILGNLGIIDTKPLPTDTSALQFILQIFANRVAAEMKRQADEDSLLHTNHRLEFTITELQRATRLKDEFLAAMSHELRTPLNAILGLTEGLQEEVFGPLNQQQLKSLATIERSGTHLLSLINDILDLSKISAGKLELELTEVSVVNLCKSSLTFVREQAYQKQIAIALDLPSTLVPLIADERRLQQVLINLLSNAVKFTPAGGKVTLGVEFQSTPSEGEWLCFWVKDTGIGIAREDLTRLFQPFIQIDSRLNRQYEGTGLGLSLVKQIIELHGGTVGVESELGQGSCFYVHLPYQSTNTAISVQTDSTKTLTLGTSLPVAASSHSPQILLVEDNEANIATISEYLTAKGYNLKIATSGCEAIEMVKRELPQLILMDIQMPEMDGLTTISHLRQHPPCADTPIIALTALAMPGDREKCLVAGANDYVTKPVALKQLALTIEQWLANEFDRN